MEIPTKHHATKLGIFGSKSARVTRLTIHGINLNSSSFYHSLYAILKDSNKSFRTQSINCDELIVWNEQFVFYKSKIRQEFQIEIWEVREWTKDHFIGYSNVIALVDNENRLCELALIDPREKTEIGTLSITVSASDDL